MLSKLLSLTVILLFTGGYASAQQDKFITEHTHHLNSLGNAKDSLYGKIIAQYDRAIAQHPHDEDLAIERCRFIQHAYYDEYEDYNPREEETAACVHELRAAFPENPDVLLYASEFNYGDSALTFLNSLADAIDENPERWANHDWKVYQLLAETYSREDDRNSEVVRYGERALEENDTLDLSLTLAPAYKNLSDNDKAIAILTANLDSTDNSWDLKQKGAQLLELGAAEKALEAYRLAALDTSSRADDGGIAEAMIKKGLITEARTYLLNDYQNNTWNKLEPLFHLLEYDLAYGTADSASLTYDRFVEENFWNDPLGIYRIRLIAISPLHLWTPGDVGRITLLLLFVLLLFIIPYLWILPLHYFGMYQRARGALITEPPYHWSLRHFWVVCSLWLFCDSAALLFFDYPGIVALFNSSFPVRETAEHSLASANIMLFFCSGNIVMTAALIKKEEISRLFSRLQDMGPLVGKGVALALLLRFAHGLYAFIVKMLGFDGPLSSSSVSTVNNDILSINDFYSPWLGFLFVVILVPIYEEILFRGVILSAVQRNMKFVYANILQSLLFALVHQQLALVPFYFTFAMLAGHFRQQTHNLTVSTSLHMTNNLIAFVFLLTRHTIKV